MPFILTVANQYDDCGFRLSALDVFESRIRKNRWFIYEGTRNRKSLQATDEILFYVSGADFPPQIVAKGQVGKARKPTFQESRQNSEAAIYSVLEFARVERLDPPIAFKNVLPSLSFAPKNMAKWGVVVLGGCRKISHQDYEKILQS